MTTGPAALSRRALYFWGPRPSAIDSPLASRGSQAPVGMALTSTEPRLTHSVTDLGAVDRRWGNDGEQTDMFALRGCRLIGQ